MQCLSWQPTVTTTIVTYSEAIHKENTVAFCYSLHPLSALPQRKTLLQRQIKLIIHSTCDQMFATDEHKHWCVSASVCQCVWHGGHTHISGVHLKPWSGLTPAEQVECCLLLKNSAAARRTEKSCISLLFVLQRTNVALTCHTPPPFFASLCSDTVCWGSEINRAYFSTGQTLDTFTAIALCNLSSTPRPYFRFGMGTRLVRTRHVQWSWVCMLVP